MHHRNFSATNLLSCFLAVAFAFAGCHTMKPGENSKDNEELRQLVVKDQEMRKNDTLDMEPVDRVHREKVMSMLANSTIRTNLDKFNAALILQHTALTFCNGKLTSISPENYLLAHHLAGSAFGSGYQEAAYMTAATIDRYLLFTKGFQKYGTQRIINEAGEEVWAPIDPKTTDAERARFKVPSLQVLLKQYRMKPFVNEE